MPIASVHGDTCTGHPHDYPPKAYSTYRQTITIERKPAEAVGDELEDHSCSCGKCGTCAGRVLAKGSATVTFERRPAARLKDPVSCHPGCTIEGPGAPTVMIGGSKEASAPGPGERRARAAAELMPHAGATEGAGGRRGR